MKRDVVRFAMLIVLIIVFSLLVYPTPYHYDKSDVAVVKHNWITGKTWGFYINHWVEIKEEE